MLVWVWVRKILQFENAYNAFENWNMENIDDIKMQIIFISLSLITG